MNIQLLIDQIVSQTTVLIAQLATSGGVRAPLAHISNDVFLNLAKELDSQGVSRKISADMFGMALRSYRRRIQRLEVSSTERNRSLWEAVLAYLEGGELKSRRDVLRRFSGDEETSVRAVLHDLCESGLVLRLGSGNTTAYRAATHQELAQLGSDNPGLEEWIWLIVYREGPMTMQQLQQWVPHEAAVLERVLEQLLSHGGVERLADGTYLSSSVVFPTQGAVGWEAALFDHYQAVVNTMCQRLRDEASSRPGEVGGSTYALKVWPGHPLEEEVRSALKQFRSKYSDLRQRLDDYSVQHPVPESYEQITIYAGQCVIAHVPDSQEETNEEFDD